MSAHVRRPSRLRRLARLFGWSRASSVLLAGFFLVILLIVYIWWPLAEQVLAYIDWGGAWWRYFDWLLVGIFGFMTLTILAQADLRRDTLIVFVGMCGGLVIEAWGTQTNLWHYYTAERPPLWIIPAWPIASLSIDRITRLLDGGAKKLTSKNRQGSAGADKVFRWSYWIALPSFYAYLFYFTAPTLDKISTWMALLLCAVLIATPTDHRRAVLVFASGSAMGYFLERWGTTRECWTYYTGQTPPFFAVLAHGMAALAFWRAGLGLKIALERIQAWIPAKKRSA